MVKALKIPKQNVQILWFVSQPELSCVTHKKTKLSEVFRLDCKGSALIIIRSTAEPKFSNETIKERKIHRLERRKAVLVVIQTAWEQFVRLKLHFLLSYKHWRGGR